MSGPPMNSGLLMVMMAALQGIGDIPRAMPAKRKPPPPAPNPHKSKGRRGAAARVAAMKGKR